MVIIVLIILGFLVARFMSLIVVFAVGFALFCILIGGALMLAESEVPPLSETSNVFEFYSSAAIMGASGAYMIGLTLAGLACVLGAYFIGVIAGRVTMHWGEQKS